MYIKQKTIIIIIKYLNNVLISFIIYPIFLCSMCKSTRAVVPNPSSPINKPQTLNIFIQVLIKILYDTNKFYYLYMTYLSM